MSENIDFVSLREALKEDCLAMYFALGKNNFGCLLQAAVVDDMTDEEVYKRAVERGIDIEEFLLK